MNELIIKNENKGDIKRIYPEEPEEINKQKEIAIMDVNNPMFVIAFKDKVLENKTEVDLQNIVVPTLINYVPDTKYNIFVNKYILLLDKENIKYDKN